MSSDPKVSNKIFLSNLYFYNIYIYNKYFIDDILKALKCLNVTFYCDFI